MIKAKGIVFMLLIALLTFGSAGQILAAPKIESITKTDGRVQLVLEFDDLKEAEWAKEYIMKMQALKVFTGYTDGTFQPNKPVTRAEAIVTAVRLLGLEDEAKAKATNTKLNFKDAELIDKKFSWAKGYVMVALEQGLFDASEDKLMPEKPASRVWVSTLLVKALGLQKEALQQMNKTPSFSDAKQIPAGSVGYVNIAVEKGLVTGYDNGSFQPNKNVTRAEMAALLDRTNDSLLENDGTIKVSGTITDIVLPVTVLSNEPEGTVTRSVYGKITILAESNQLQTYEFATGLLVGYQGSYIKVDQLKVMDYVRLVVKDNQIVEANIVEPNELKDEEKSKNNVGISEFKLEIELGEKAEVEISLKNKGKAEAKVEIESKTQKVKLKGKEATDFIAKLLTESNISDSMSNEEMVEALLAALEIDVKLVNELELKIKFANGKEVKVDTDKEE